MLELFFLILYGYLNNSRAKAKGLSGVTWAIYTAISFLIAYFMGVFVAVSAAIHGRFDLMANANRSEIQGTVHQVTEEFKSNPLLIFTIYLFGLGGYLLVRFLIDRKPGKPQEPLHWMDKLNNDNQPH
jgi:hypothetical protein